MKEVAITGMGIISPLGLGVDRNWDAIKKSVSGISKIKKFDCSDISSQIAGMVPEGSYKFEDYLDPKEKKKIDDFILYSIIAAQEAVKDSGIDTLPQSEKDKIGVSIGSGIGGLPVLYDTSVTLHTRGPRRVSPFFIPSALVNLAPGYVAIKFGLKGHNKSIVSACATGTHSIGEAFKTIQSGGAKIILAGGAEAAVCRLGLAGFASMRALSTKYNDAPKSASRPWDTKRDGFILSEGSGILILEEYENAKKRGAKIYAKVAGYGASSDAFHITAPDGDGAVRSMQECINDAKISTSEVGYINAHGTSTPAGDLSEASAVKSVFKNYKDIPMSSTKSATGHTLGAAGSIEAIYTIKALQDGVLPPTLNLQDPEPELKDMNLVPHMPQEKNIDYALSNSFGFGGTNASILFKKQ